MSSCPGLRLACQGCFAGLARPNAKAEARSGEGAAWVWHGGLPMKTADTEGGGMPGYIGVISQETHQLGPCTVKIETWPDFRIGSVAWPSGKLLARALAEGVDGLPGVRGLRVAELGAGPALPSLVCGQLGAAEVAMTDRQELVQLMARNIELNGLTAACRAEALDWPLAAESPLAADRRRAAGAEPLDLLLAADVVYFEEQDPLVEAMVALMAPQTLLVLAYRERTGADRMYLELVILPKLDYTRLDYENPGHGSCEIYVGRLR